MDSAVHAARGALVAGGGLAAAQSLLAGRLRKPSGLALSVGGFVGTFRFFESLGTEYYGDKEAAKRHVPSAAAGVAALVAVYFLEAQKKGLVLSYAALEALLQLIKEHTSIADIKHIEVPMAMLTHSRNLYVWIFDSHLHTKSRLATLDGLTLFPRDVIARVRAELPVNPGISRCDVFHAGQSCGAFHWDYVKTQLRHTMKLFIPIYFFSAVVTKYDKWLWGPRPNVRALLVQYLRTSAYLGLSFCVQIGFSCVSPFKSHRTSVVLAGMLTTLATWIEHEKRRVAVLKGTAVYPIAATAAQVGLALKLSPKSVSLWQYVIFSASMALLFQHPERQNARVMRLLFGHRVRASQRANEGSAATEKPSRAVTKDSPAA